MPDFSTLARSLPGAGSFDLRRALHDQHPTPAIGPVWKSISAFRHTRVCLDEARLAAAGIKPAYGVSARRIPTRERSRQPGIKIPGKINQECPVCIRLGQDSPRLLQASGGTDCVGPRLEFPPFHGFVATSQELHLRASRHSESFPPLDGGAESG